MTVNKAENTSSVAGRGSLWFSVQMHGYFLKIFACGGLDFSKNGSFFQNGSFFSSMVAAKSVWDAKREINCTRPKEIPGVLQQDPCAADSNGGEMPSDRVG